MKRAAPCLLLTGCSLDPFNPAIGPRNPEPGAARYLATRDDISQSDKEAVLAYHNCPATVLRDLARSPSRETRAMVAANPMADVGVLDRLSSDPDPAVRQYVGSNSNISRPILKRLASDPDRNVRWGLAANPKWTAGELRWMHENKAAAPSVLASNPSTPPDVLKELTYGSDPGTLTSLARNPSIPPYVFKRLANDPNPTIRLMLADNKSVPLPILKQLANDPDERVRDFALDQLERRE